MNQNHDIGQEYQELIHQVKISRKYRRAFVVTLCAAVVLAFAVLALWWRTRTRPAAINTQSTGTTETSDMSTSTPESGSGGRTEMPAQSETPLNPIQLSPQRMQSIGIQIGQVQSKTVSDELR